MRVLHFAFVLCAKILLVTTGCQAQAPGDGGADGASVAVERDGEDKLLVAGAQGAKQARMFHQYGPSGIGYGVVEDHFINILAQNDYATINGRTPDGQRISVTDLVEGGYFDLKTKTWVMLPNQQPIELGFIRGRAKEYPEYYSGRYVVTWEGDGNLVFRLGEPSTFRRVGNNRLELSFAPDQTTWTRVLLTRIGKDGIRNIKIFRAEEEDNLNAGYFFSQNFRQLVSQYDIVRTMDLNTTNNSWIRSVEQLAPLDWFTWGGQNSALYPFDVPRGFPLAANFILAKETDVSLWLNVPAILGAPDIFDQVDYFEKVAGERPNGESYSLLRERAAAHSAEILASNAIDKYADAVVRALEEYDYPHDRKLYLEFGNETWNFAWAFGKTPHYLGGISDYLSERHKRSGSIPYGYGYMSARFAAAFERALKRAGRIQSWTMVIGVQTAVPFRTASIIDGLEDYMRDESDGQGFDRKKLQRFGVVTASYFSGGFIFIGPDNMFGAPTREAWSKRFLTELRRDPEALRNRIKDWILNGPAVGYTRAWVIEQKAAHRKTAISRGLQYLGDYEGGDHDILDPSLHKNADALKFYNEFRSSTQAAEIRRGVETAIAKNFPGTITSDYGRIYGYYEGRPRPPWMEHMWGEDTPLKREIEERLQGRENNADEQQ